eukprot:GHVU01181169.1.p2 GENE.GHVU01181169.1~~GHVU01181169.1.p2  ORF type:complete len:110 (+),score=13.09 GHVU01181169.1:419-748(+)
MWLNMEPVAAIGPCGRKRRTRRQRVVGGRLVRLHQNVNRVLVNVSFLRRDLTLSNSKTTAGETSELDSKDKDAEEKTDDNVKATDAKLNAAMDEPDVQLENPGEKRLIM